MAKGLPLVDQDFSAGESPTGAAPAAARESGASHTGRPSGLPGELWQDEDFVSPVVPNGTVIHGKFRVLAARRRAGDELTFKALHLGTGRRVELRLLAEGVLAESPEAERMLRSARAAGRAPHSNVLNVVDSGLDAECRPFVVYEQFAGVPCSDLIARRGPCALSMAADIVGQVLDGLSALHARGVFHRQLRSENVLVDGTADQPRVKLIGLGYSLMHGRDAVAPELPRGYSRYLAPEARRGEAVATPAVDIYAAGVLLRYLLTGIDHGEAKLPNAVEPAVARAVSEDPDERFQTAEQFRACISAIAGPATRESLLPSGSLLSDLRFMLRRREAAQSERLHATQPDPVSGAGKLEHYPTLLVIESLYARIGAAGWHALLADLPDTEQLLPAAGLADQHREHGVSATLVEGMLARADAFGGRGNLRLLSELGEELARRGIRRFCSALPSQLTPECLVACVPVIWRSLVRDGEVTPNAQHGGSARMSVRCAQPSLELSALFAGLLRGQLQLLSPRGEVNWVASQALDDGADVLVLSW